jgi:hypothetical protein
MSIRSRGTTSSFSRTASGKVAAVAVLRRQVFAEAPPTQAEPGPLVHGDLTGNVH